jgi:hypothetical protein
MSIDLHALEERAERERERERESHWYAQRVRACVIRWGTIISHETYYLHPYQSTCAGVRACARVISNTLATH